MRPSTTSETEKVGFSLFAETLAFHFSRSRSNVKAVEYLVKSGKKSLARYAVEEAHQYFKEAYDILRVKTEKSSDEEIALVDMLNDWGYVYYYLGDINTWIDLLTAHKELAESLEDNGRLGMFYAWLGIAHFMGGRPSVAFDYLKRAFDLAESCRDQKVVGYACTWLAWACVDLARFDEAATYGEKAQEIARLFPSDQYLYFKSLGGLGYLHWLEGDLQKGREIGELLLAYGERNANSRSKVIGHLTNFFAQFHLGDIPASLRSGEKSIEASEDPTYIQFGRLSVGLYSLSSGDFAQVEKVLKPVVDFCEKGGCHVFLPWACIFLGAALIAQGRMNQGMELLEKARQMIDEGQKKVCEVYYEYVLGNTYSLIATGPKPSLAVMARNIGFLVKNVPTASKKAIHHLKRAIEVSKEIGSNGPLGLAYLDLGLFYKSKKDPNQAREYLSQAIHLFEKSQAENYLKQAKDAVASPG